MAEKALKNIYAQKRKSEIADARTELIEALAHYLLLTTGEEMNNEWVEKMNAGYIAMENMREGCGK